MSHEAEKYTSDMRDEQWERLHRLRPLEQNGPGRPLELNLRAVVDAIFYVLRTGCQWHPMGTRLPKTYPNYQRVYYH